MPLPARTVVMEGERKQRKKKPRIWTPVRNTWHGEGASLVWDLGRSSRRADGILLPIVVKMRQCCGFEGMVDLFHDAVKPNS